MIKFLIISALFYSLNSNLPETVSFSGADYLVISHHSFSSHLQPLADLRDSLGLSVEIIDDTTIYHLFPGDSCQAIKNFIFYAYTTWNPSPSYILLVGDAGEDGGSNNFIPSKIQPKYSYYYAGGLTQHCSDNWYVELTGNDLIPEIPIGRLPVNTVQELDSVINNIVRYETSINTMDSIMIVMAGEYVGAMSIIFNTIPYHYQQFKYYGTDLSADSCHQLILNTFNQGLDIVFALCHGCNPTCPSLTWSGNFVGGSAQIVFSDQDFPQIISHHSLPIIIEFG